MKIERGDILLFQTNTIIGQAIRHYTKSDWSHCAMFLDRHYLMNFHFKGKGIISLHDVRLDPETERFAIYTDRENNRPETLDVLVDRVSQLFKSSEYDKKIIYRLKGLVPDDRTYMNLQTKPDQYTCSNMIARAYSMGENEGWCFDPLRGFYHWSQAAPMDFERRFEKKHEEWNYGD